MGTIYGVEADTVIRFAIIFGTVIGLVIGYFIGRWG